MRKLIFGINFTMDGCCDHTKGIPDEAVHAYFARLMEGADTLVYGRKTYELMVPYWPDVARSDAGETQAIKDFARAFDAVEKMYVVSRSLQSVAEDKTTIINTDIREEINRLKQQPGKNIMTGGVDLPSQLIQMGLVDEFHIVMQPIIAGEGRRFMDATILPKATELKLISAQVLGGGHVAMHYERVY